MQALPNLPVHATADDMANFVVVSELLLVLLYKYLGRYCDIVELWRFSEGEAS